MAVIQDSELPVMAAEKPVAQSQELLESQQLQLLAMALGMDPNTKNKLQVPDLDWLQV
jgi:hypothetical protein